MDTIQNNQNICEEDEIDLRELFLTLKKNKKIIILITLITTFAALIYVIFKNLVPIYQGYVMVEIGEVKSANPKQTYFDNPQVLKNILENKYNVKIEIPKRQDSLFKIIDENTNKKEIAIAIKKVYKYILERHKEKEKLFSQYIMTHMIGNITIDSQPINLPKKKLILTVAFITGLILSIFLVFFLEFIKGLKEEEHSL